MRFNFKLNDSTKQFKVFSIAVLSMDGKVLMIQDATSKHHGRWSLPSKEVTIETHASTAAEVALKEVTNIRAKVDYIVGVYQSHDIDASIGSIVIVYALKNPQGTLQINSETSLNANWFSYAEIAKIPLESLHRPYLPKIIRDYRKGKQFPADLIQHV